jgi:hypothetical protein
LVVAASWLRSVFLSGLVVALLVLVAFAASGRPLGIGGGGDGPGNGFFDYAWTTVVLVFLVALALGVWSAWQGRGVRRELQPRRRSWLGVLVYIVAFAVLASVLQATGLARLLQRHTSAPQSGGPAAARHPRPPPAPRHTAVFRWQEAVVVAGALAAAAAAAAARRRRGAVRLPALGRRAEAVSAALDDAVDDLRAEPDVRKAIVAAYARTEAALADAGLARRRAEAPLEYLERALAALDASAGSISRLTNLYERAKFSRHELGPAAKDEAIDALLAVRDELRAPEREAA